jgi:N-acyl-D-aspartate/D-glutamate deacylase
MKGAMVGIKDGKIVEIGKLGNLKNLSEHCKNVIDAEGLAVSPGFIDIHSHTDTNLLVAPVGDSKIYQGVTTDI